MYKPDNEMSRSAKEGLGYVNDGLINQDSDFPVTVKEYNNKLANGEELTLEEVAEVFSFFFKNVKFRTREFCDFPPSNQRIQWQANGSCDTYGWAHKIVQDAIDAGEMTVESLGDLTGTFPGYISYDDYIEMMHTHK
jgi:hypothetical protein